MLLKQPLAFYSESLAGVDREELQGKLIVIEGPDSVGRSTQVARLRTWLEHQGHAVLDTGMARGALAGKGIQQAKEGNTLGPITMTLFYATDFADRLENEIIPALRAGFVVSDGPLHFFADGARHCAGRRSALDRTSGQFCAGPARHLLFARRGPRSGAARGAGPGRIRSLGERHGYALRRGHARQFRQVPSARDSRAGPHGEALQLRSDRCHQNARSDFPGAATIHR